jgi:hypothetical protein
MAEEKAFRVKWFHTEEFEADITLDEQQVEAYEEAEDEEREDILTEMLMDVIIDMDHDALTGAFQGCTEREITETEELEA